MLPLTSGRGVCPFSCYCILEQRCLLRLAVQCAFFLLFYFRTVLTFTFGGAVCLFVVILSKFIVVALLAEQCVIFLCHLSIRLSFTSGSTMCLFLVLSLFNVVFHAWQCKMPFTFLMVNFLLINYCCLHLVVECSFFLVALPLYRVVFYIWQCTVYL